MQAWLQRHDGLLAVLGLVSALTLLLGLVLVPWLVLRLPADHFLRPPGASRFADRHPLLRLLLHGAASLLGGLLLAAGAVMLVLPGPGVLTVLAGLMLLDFPGKHRLERWLATRGPVWDGVNHLRRRFRRPELLHPDGEPARPGRLLWQAGHAVRVLRAGADYFPALVAALDGAQESVHLDVYIFRADRTGRRVAAALARAARRGVRVSLLVDGFGSAGFHERLGPVLARAGVRVLLYRFSRWLVTPRRLHRKVAVVDGRLALVGGINIEDDDPHAAGLAPFRMDYALHLAGPGVQRIALGAVRLWNRMALVNLRRRWQVALPPHAPPAPADGVRLAWTERDAFRRRAIERAYLEAIAGAEREILLAHAYFLPTRRLRRALAEAVRRGVAVRVLVQGRVEYRTVHWAAAALHPHLLAAGVRLHAYLPTFLHAKVMVVDRRLFTVGSSNLDPLSLRLTLEANAWVDDPALAAPLADDLRAMMERDAAEIVATDLERRPWWTRLRHRAAWWLIRLLIHLAGPRDPA